MDYKYLGKKVRFTSWTNDHFWLITEVSDNTYIGHTYYRGKKHNNLRLSVGFTHDNYTEITTKVKVTRLAKKMYPKAKEVDGYLIIEDVDCIILDDSDE